MKGARERGRRLQKLMGEVVVIVVETLNEMEFNITRFTDLTFLLFRLFPLQRECIIFII